MPREKEAYYDNFEMIDKAFPDKPILNLAEVSRWMRKDPRTVQREYPFKGTVISKATLARAMC